MTMIRLTAPLAMSEFLARPRLFPGRHLGEDELDRLQAYADARLAPLTATSRPGILTGLGCRAGDAPERRGARVLVEPGLAVAGDGQLVGLFVAAQATWAGLVTAWLREQRASDAVGVYYLVLKRGLGVIDAGAAVDPCQRAEPDPLRDLRREVLGTLGLRRLAVDPAGLAAMTPAQVQNQVAARHVDGAFLGGLGGAVPLALLAVSVRAGGPPLAELDPARVDQRFQVDWCEPAAGRYLAVPHAGARVLFEQVQTAWRAAVERALAARPADAAPFDLAAALESGLRLDFLPAAGALPLALLEAADQPRPRLRWLPQHLAVDMVPVPEEAVAELIERELPRRVLDLRRPTGDRIRLLLAVNEPDYRPDLLDFPAIDAELVKDLYRTHLRAYQAWRDWRIGFDALYAVQAAALLTPAEVRALAFPAVLPQPVRPGQFYAELIRSEGGKLPLVEGRPPHPYDDGTPPAPAFYHAWLVNGEPPAVPAPQDDGLVVRYRATQLDLERLDHRIRALRARLEKHRDYLLLQRQQLDAQTVSLAALGGGVAGDGSGLQMARWLPFTKLRDKAVAGEAPASDADAPQPPAAPSAVGLSASLAAPSLLAGVSIRDLGQPQPFASKAVLNRTAAVSLGRDALRLAGLSTVEANLKRDRLNKLDAVPKRPLTTPALEGRSYQFGVLDHIQAEVREYEATYRGMRDLIESLDGLFAPVEATSIRRVLEGFGVPVSPNALAAEQTPKAYPLGRLDLERIGRLLDDDQLPADARTALRTVRDQYQTFLAARSLSNETLDDYATPDPKRRFAALFEAGQILTRQIAWMEDRYQRLEDRLEGRLRERIRLEGALDRLAAEIESAGRKLAVLNAKRLESLSDYGIAQALTREDWDAVYRRDQARTEILTKRLRGLYYVRVRETPVSASLAARLPLTHGSARDPVPGCDWDTEVDVPPALAEVFATVLEVPFADWRPLTPLVPKLPVERLPELLGLHRYRLTQRQAGGPAGALAAGLAARLAPVLTANAALLQDWSASAPSGADARNRYLAETARVLSLADALGLTGPLQREVQTLHDRLEQCVVCLMDRLGRVTPSLRFAWGQLAEDDRLPTDEPARWPGLERAEAADFTAVRTIAELIAWWFRQLADDASGAGRAALRNLIRAAVIVAAHGDPGRVLEGRVAVPPRRLAVGEAMRLALPGSPPAGTRLQLLDDSQRVVGLIAVKDHDQGGILAQVVRVDAAVAEVTTRFTVVSAALSAEASPTLAAKAGRR
ncbi:MAG: hypothetical protein MUC77_08025 [Chromatiaceae bacterium]|jgi:hypothetical protein|nr:hypothetical protein [Chromatiaceae bacterium]